MERKKTIIIGTVTMLTILIFVWGIDFLKGKNILLKERNYYAVFEDVGGLNVGSPVTIKGFQVGQIKDVSFSDIYASKIIVTFDIEKDVKIPLGSILEIYNSDLLGSKGLQILLSKNTKFHTAGDTLKSGTNVGMLAKVTQQIEPLSQKTEALLVSIDSTINSLNSIISTNQEAVKTSIANIETITYNFEKLSSSLNTMLADDNGKLNIIISNIESISTMLKNNENEIANTIANLSNFSDSLTAINYKQIAEQTNFVLKNLQEITQKINNGDGSLSLLLNNDSLYYNIESLSKNLEELSQDMKKNPKKYFNLSIIDVSKTTNN